MNEKCVMIIDESLSPGETANVAAVLGITLGRLVPEAVGRDVRDGVGGLHSGVIEVPVPILKADRAALGRLRLRLCEARYSELAAADFTELAQSCKTYDEYIDKMSYASELNYIGLAIYGDRKKVNSLTGNLPLL